MKSIRVILAFIVSFVIGAVMIQSAMAASIDDPTRQPYYDTLKGK